MRNAISLRVYDYRLEFTMGVDCSAVAGFGIELTNEIVEKMITAGIFTADEWDDDKDGCLDASAFSYGEIGSKYSGHIKRYLFVTGDTIKKLSDNEPVFIAELGKIGVAITSDDIEWIESVLWW